MMRVFGPGLTNPEAQFVKPTKKTQKEKNSDEGVQTRAAPKTLFKKRPLLGPYDFRCSQIKKAIFIKYLGKICEFFTNLGKNAFLICQKRDFPIFVVLNVGFNLFLNMRTCVVHLFYNS